MALAWAKQWRGRQQAADPSLACLPPPASFCLPATRPTSQQTGFHAKRAGMAWQKEAEKEGHLCWQERQKLMAAWTGGCPCLGTLGSGSIKRTSATETPTYALQAHTTHATPHSQPYMYATHCACAPVTYHLTPPTHTRQTSVSCPVKFMSSYSSFAFFTRLPVYVLVVRCWHAILPVRAPTFLHHAFCARTGLRLLVGHCLYALHA